MSPDLQRAAAADKALREELLRQFPTLGEDEPALVDTLDGESDFDEHVRAVVVSALADEDLAEGLTAALKARKAEWEKRIVRLQERAYTKRLAIQTAMELAGRKRFEFPEATVYIRAPGKGKVIVTDESKLDDPRFWRAKPAEIDKIAIGEALDAGETVEGATRSNPMPTLQIKAT